MADISRSSPAPAAGQKQGPAIKTEVSSEAETTTATGALRPRCSCQSTFQSSEQVLGAIQSDADTSSLIEWLAGEEIREEGDEFVLIRRDDDSNVHHPHANTYGRCPARVGAAFAILNAIRDACRTHLDRQQSTAVSSSSSLLPLGPSAGSSGTSGFVQNESTTSPVKARYEDDFPSLLSSSSGAETATIFTTSSASAASANVLIPRKKKKKQQQPAKEASAETDPRRRSFPIAKSVQPQQKAPVPKSAPKKRIRPVSLKTTTSSSSPWPAASSTSVATLASDVIKKGNIASQPSQDPLNSNVVNSSLSSKSSKSCWGGSSSDASAPIPAAATMSGTIGFGAARPPPGFGSGMVDSDATAAIPATPRKLDGSFAKPEIDPATSQSPSERASSVGRAIPRSADNEGDETAREMDDETLNRLVGIYTTLILHQLVPSVPLELHLLVRLLSLNTDSGTRNVPFEEADAKESVSAGIIKFRGLFSTTRSCRVFASRALTELETPVLSSLGHVVLRKLVELPSMKEVLPDVVGSLRRLFDERNRVLDRAESLEGAVVGMSITGSSNTPFLTVPFDENRDSKHNYRSRDRTLLFNNREESRDKFMFQLRAFQEIRGTVLDPAQADVYISDIKVACREMMHGLLPGNMGWFAGLFTNLLLQIGLVAVEETDKDVLKQVADKDRLKKLHRRFTAKGGQKNKSSQRLVLDNNNKSSPTASSSSLQPEHFFSGHQEFFFIFLRTVDSYQFSIHLRRRLVGLINEMNSVADARGLENRVLRIQLLAKFLGMLVFSPHWNSTSTDAINKTNAAVMADSKEALAHLNCTTPILNLRAYIEECWRNGRLVVTIPWVVEFLRMASWDTVSLQASYYQKIFAILRSIHRRLGQQHQSSAEGLASNLQLVSFQLEVLFADVIGLVKADALPLVVLPSRPTLSIADANDDKPMRFDMIPLNFTKLYLFASSSYLEEFYKLISELVEKKDKAGGRVGASKKLRPYAITAQVDGIVSRSSPFSKQMESVNGTLIGQNPSSPHANLISPQKGINNRRNKISIQEKLIDAFFHQHNDLQQVCEFVVERSVKNALSVVVKDHIAPGFAVPASDFDCAFDAFLKMIRQKEQDALATACGEMKAQCDRMVRESIKLLSSPETKAAVLDIATDLSTRHSQEKGEEHISQIVRQEAQKRIDEYIKAEAVKKRSKSASRSATCRNAEVQSAAGGLAKDLRAAAAILEQVGRSEAPWTVSQSNQALFRGVSESFSAVTQPGNLPWNEYCLIEEDGRKFVTALLSVLRTWFSAPSNERRGYPPLFLDAITISIGLAKVGLPYYGLKRIGNVCCKHAHDLKAWNEVSSCSGVGTGSDDDKSSARRLVAPSTILTGMLEVEMITPRELDVTLNSIRTLCNDVV